MEKMKQSSFDLLAGIQHFQSDLMALVPDLRNSGTLNPKVCTFNPIMLLNVLPNSYI